MNTRHSSFNADDPTARTGARPLPHEVIGALSHDISRHRILSAAEAAAFLNLSTAHFRRLYRNGGAPAPLRLSERRLGWPLFVLIEWLETRQSRPVTA
jgi:predicted DNA-binding transcriptional regulator AlpA